MVLSQSKSTQSAAEEIQPSKTTPAIFCVLCVDSLCDLCGEKVEARHIIYCKRSYPTDNG